MESNLKKSIERKKKRVLRIRKRIHGTSDRPRLSINRTNRQLFAQLIDDINHKTLLSISSLSKDLKSISTSPTVSLAKEMGEILAQEAEKKGITQAVLDRRGNKYSGKIAALAEALRDKGFKI